MPKAFHLHIQGKKYQIGASFTFSVSITVCVSENEEDLYEVSVGSLRSYCPAALYYQA